MILMKPMVSQRHHRALMICTLLLTAITFLTASTRTEAAICLNCEATPVPGIPTTVQSPPPMLALQFDECLFSSTSIFSTALTRTSMRNLFAGHVNGMFAQMRKALKVKDSYSAEAARTDQTPFLHAELWPSADIRIADCVAQKAGGFGTNIAIWFEQPGFYGMYDTVEKRDWWTNNLDVRQIDNHSGQFGVNVHDSAIQAFLRIVKSYSQQKINREVKGTALENKVKIRGSTVTYDNLAKRITTRVDARIDGIVTGEYTNFWALMRDTLGLTERYVGYGQAPWFNDYVAEAWCSGTAKVDYDGSVDMFLANIALNVAGPIVTAFNDGQDLNINHILNRTTRMLQGPGCEITKAFSAKQYLIPNTTQKLVMDYPALKVQEGVTLLGRVALAWRNMYVNINGVAGPGIIYLQPGTQLQGQFTAATNDLDAPVSYSWEATGATITNPTSPTPTIRWPTQIASGQQLSRTIKVTARDASGHQVSKQVNVVFRTHDTIIDTDCVKYVCN